MNNEQLKEISELLELNTQKEAIKSQMELLKKDIARKISPYKVGDVIDAKGYGFGKKCRIVESFLKIDPDNIIELHVRAVVLTKSGADSKSSLISWADYSDPKLDAALLKAKGETTP